MIIIIILLKLQLVLFMLNQLFIPIDVIIIVIVITHKVITLTFHNFSTNLIIADFLYLCSHVK